MYKKIKRILIGNNVIHIEFENGKFQNYEYDELLDLRRS